MKKILGLVILMSLVIPFLSSAKMDDRLENREQRINQIINRASTTERRLENRENNIERIRERIASTTASSTNRLEKLDDRLQKQEEQMGKVKDRLLNKELKITDVLGKIASKIQARITILEGKNLNMTAAKAKLALAAGKIEEMTVETATLTDLLETEINIENQTALLSSVKIAQEKIRGLAKEVHALLVDTVKEITKVLPAKTATTTATTTI
jgi:hypothetical protein